MSNIKYSAITDGPKKLNTIIWSVEDFPIVMKKKTIRVLRTEKCKDPTVDPSVSTVQFKMKFLGRDNDIMELYYFSPTPVITKSILEISLATNKILTKEYSTLNANEWQYLCTFSKHDITRIINLGATKSSLHIKLQFMLMNYVKIESNVPGAPLSDDLENLLINGLYSDVTIKSAEDVSFKAHKGVLASRSAVLKAHFEHNTTECFTNVVESTLEADVLREVLTFIYTDKAPQVDEIPEKLLAAADYYQLHRLKSLCEEALHKRLTVENAIETLQLADLHSANALKQLTLEFIKDGQATLITKTEGWTKYNSAELIQMIYEHVMADDEASDES